MQCAYIGSINQVNKVNISSKLCKSKFDKQISTVFQGGFWKFKIQWFFNIYKVLLGFNLTYNEASRIGICLFFTFFFYTQNISRGPWFSSEVDIVLNCPQRIHFSFDLWHLNNVSKRAELECKSSKIKKNDLNKSRKKNVLWPLFCCLG